ncbi:unnamed protein product [Clavelina lepadiformis]|uniref:PiggyBac transposable element-derived protein domain-containing protein n=1 Tax=Clavelina lepadiformis TaxID=159417 RepID=A0ABP0GG38_CLALP
MERRWLTFGDVERLLDEEDLESTDDEYLSSDDGDADHICDCASSDTSVESDSEDVSLTAATRNENTTQLWSKDDDRPIFNKIMSCGRFQQILKVLRFDDAEKEEEIDLRTNFNQSEKFLTLGIHTYEMRISLSLA